MYGWMEDSIPMTARPKTMDLNTFTLVYNWMVSALRAQDCKIGCSSEVPSYLNGSKEK